MLRLPRWRGLTPLELALAALLVIALVVAVGSATRVGQRDAAGDGVRVAAVTTTAPRPAGVTAPAPAATAAGRTPSPMVAATRPTPPGEATAAAGSTPAAPTPAPARTPGPTPAPGTFPVAPVVTLRPQQVGVGETLFVTVRAPGADSGSLLINGLSIPLARQGELLWAVVGVPLDAPLGRAVLTATTRDAAGTASAGTESVFRIVAVDRPIDDLYLTEETAAILTVEAAQREQQLRGEQFSRFDRGRWWSGRFVRPIAGEVTTEFGQGRRINGGPPGGFHSGTDFAADAGATVVAAAAGRVSWVGSMPIRGLTVTVDHGAGVLTGYSHLSEPLVRADQLVREGEPIGRVGSTGLSTGPHLHWELSIYGVNVDPVQWTEVDFTP
ncbi:MAG: M23 family metallopeptidase [Chloroflexi bacterium]|nr:M23 family metallopeptidase [Chloroflexota bacterium]